MNLFNSWEKLNSDDVPSWVKRLTYKKRYGTHVYYGKETKYRVTWVTKLDNSRGRIGHHMGQDTGMEYPVIRYPEYERKKI